MRPEPVVFTIPRPGGWSAMCTEHGRGVLIWGDPVFAAYDAMGHTAAHHRVLPSPAGADPGGLRSGDAGSDPAPWADAAPVPGGSIRAMPAITPRRRRHRWLNRRKAKGRTRPRPLVLRVVNAMSVSASAEKATRIWERALDQPGEYGVPDVVNGCEMAKVKARHVPGAADFYVYQEGKTGSPDAALALAVRRSRGTMSGARLRAGTPATSEGDGIRRRPILEARVHMDPGTPQAWTFGNDVLHAPPPRAPRARRRFLDVVRTLTARVVSGDMNLTARLAARAIGRRVVGHGVICAAVRRWIPTSAVATVDLGGDHLAIDIIIWP